MATKIFMKHPSTGVTKIGFYGFSWTSFFFGGIPAIMRGDVGIGLGVLLGGIVASVLSAGLLWFIIGLIWAFIYNKRYTIGLVERGYVFEDSPGNTAAAKQSLGIAG